MDVSLLLLLLSQLLPLKMLSEGRKRTVHQVRTLLAINFLDLASLTDHHCVSNGNFKGRHIPGGTGRHSMFTFDDVGRRCEWKFDNN
jgi:hypothetical protein